MPRISNRNKVLLKILILFALHNMQPQSYEIASIVILKIV